jgi:hypothetical protein
LIVRGGSTESAAALDAWTQVLDDLRHFVADEEGEDH